MLKHKLVNYLDDYLKISDFKDDSKNGLQVDTEKKEIEKIWYAVDATAYIFDKAIKEKIDMVIVHHGMFRGFENPITGNTFQKIKRLIKNDIALYGCHLPLDAHPKLWNNIRLLEEFLKYFKIKRYKQDKVCEYKGQTIGFGARFSKKIPIEEMHKFCKAIGIEEKFYNFWDKKYIQSVATVSGGGLNSVADAKKNNYDLYITWEGVHHEYISAKEMWQSVIVWWHYETEVFWVQALAKHLEKKFKLKTVFLDEKY